MRKRTPTNGKVAGIKFVPNENKDDDLKKAKEDALKVLEEREQNSQEWYDKEMDKNLKKP